MEKKGKTVTKLFSVLLAMALFITMMPFGAAAVFADDGSEQPAAALTVIGDDLVAPLTFESIKQLKNDEGIKAVTLNDVKFHTVNSKGTEEDLLVSGVTIESLISLAGLKEGEKVQTVTAIADDGFKKVYTADEILKEDLEGNKAMYIWTEGSEKVQKTAIGQFEAGENNKGKWVKNVVTIIVNEPVLTVAGEGLVNELSFKSIKAMKNDEAIKQTEATFKTKNAAGDEGESKVKGVKIEDLIALAGIKDGYVVDKVIATAEDGHEVSYDADEVFKEDLQGNKAMFVWEYDGEKVQMTAVGQYKKGETNKARWVAGLLFSLEVKTKAVTKPGKPKVTLTAGKKKATVKWKKVTGAAGYEIWRSTKKTKGFKRVKTITKGSTVKFINKSLKGKKAYYYKVRAYKKDANGNKIYGSYSSVKKVTTKK